jgi:hypothetical protein
MMRWMIVGLLLGSLAGCGQAEYQVTAKETQAQPSQQTPPVSVAPMEEPTMQPAQQPIAEPEIGATAPALPPEPSEPEPEEENQPDE